jgi:diguanylate cyclase (GGDEF)-like protein
VVLSGRLPVIVDGGHFRPIWSHWFAPSVVVVNAAVALLVIRSGRRKLSLFQLWLAVALAMAALDGLLNTWALGRYSLAWYLGKIETLVTASVVMLMLLSEVGALYRNLGTMAIMDPLTGLRNRRSFDEYLRWSLGHRAEAGVAFLLLDIDFFKQYNDRYGHAAGDACLRRIANCLRDSLWRSIDLVARYGGEEFVVLLPDTTAIGGLEVAERIRQRVEALAIEHAGSKVGRFITVSVGVAHAPASNGIDGDRLFALADGALYRAKIQRNVSVVASPADMLSPGVELQPQAADAD